MRAMILMVVGLVLAGCATPVPVDRPCGVITDSLRDVHATTPEGETRLNVHFERGVAARCWVRK